MSRTTRRTFIGGLSTAALSTFIPIRSFAQSACHSIVPSADTGPAPDILFISVDDLNDWVSPLAEPYELYKPLDNQLILTPNMQALANSGVTFQNAFADSVACAPSRNTVMSGLPPYETGIVEQQPPHGLDPDYFVHPNPGLLCNSIPGMLRRAPTSYFAYGSGKIFNSIRTSTNGIAPWDLYFEETPYPGISPPPPDISGLVAGIPEGLIATLPDAQLASNAETFLSNQSGLSQPLFMAVGFRKPHLDWQVPQTLLDHYMRSNIRIPEYLDEGTDQNDLTVLSCLATRDQVPGNSPTKGNWVPNVRTAIAGYLAAMTFVDQQIGRVINAFNTHRANRRRIIILWSDHGFALGKKRAWRKFRFYSNVSRVPIIISDSAGVNPGASCSQMVALRDIYLTTLKYAKIERPAFLQNRPETKSLRQLVENPTLSTWGRTQHVITYNMNQFLRVGLAAEGAAQNNLCKSYLPTPAAGTINTCPIQGNPICADSGVAGASFALRQDRTDGTWLYFNMRHTRASGGTQIFAGSLPNEELYLIKANAGNPTLADPQEATNLLKNTGSAQYAAHRSVADSMKMSLSTVVGAYSSLDQVLWP
jgi:arylsulfatase A-like enzyme